MGDDQVVFTDAGHQQIKMLALTRSNKDNERVTLKVTVSVGSGIAGTRDGSYAEFSQPTGICGEGKTCFVADTATGRLRMVTDPAALLKFLATLNTFARAFSLHHKKEKKQDLSLDVAISKVKEVNNLVQECLKNVRNLTGLQDKILQGPEGVCSQQCRDDVNMLLKSLERLQALLSRINPSYLQSFKLSSLLTLVVENFFSEMREGNDMPTTLQFGYKFSACTGEIVKRLSTTSFTYYTSSSSYYKRPSGFLEFADLPRMEPPKHHALTDRQRSTLPNWRVEHGQSVRQVTVRNFSTKDKPGTLLLNVYLLEEPTPHPLALSTTSRQTDETGDIHAQSKGSSPITLVSPVDLLQPKKPVIACVRAGFHASEARPSPFYLASHEAPPDDSTRVTSALWFSQDISHPLRFVEDLRAPFKLRQSHPVLTRFHGVLIQCA